MPLRVIALNVNSLLNFDRRMLLLNFIENNFADIYAISETKLDPNRNTKFRVNGFNIFHQKNAHNRGGTSIIINNSIRTRYVSTGLPPIEHVSLEFLAGNSWLGLSSVYLNSNMPINRYDFFRFFYRVTERKAVHRRFQCSTCRLR